ncbi:sarcosine oxidase subunit gamma [Hyphomicrobium methylovorum]|uniref:sarcosine oxidase subunit gamma n=1 Tax=Hyphomicrobium methylovorum TaxID=84 RepID=UPI0031B5E771
MASPTLAARSAFTHATPIAAAGLVIRPHETLTMASITASKGKVDQVRAVIREHYGAELTNTPQRVTGKDIAFVWTGPDQWTAVAERGENRDIELELKPLLAGLAAIVDQSDARAVVQISGPRAREVLAKGVPIDLHPREFPRNGVAITHASHIGIILWQMDDKPTYEIAVFRSFADSLWHWLESSAAEFV